ncbi:hypothetical protein [Priestia megaterium]|uniref:hypothetical protein n=1 Tax=Priestia megaterium TaxID=1404 RepID=UPI002E225617|nr:hypothetical protein [Priestia megaterium]
MNKKKGDDDEMPVVKMRPEAQRKADRKKKVQASFAKAVARNDKALERLSKN